MAKTPALGSPAPDVDLPGWVDGASRQFRLSEQRGSAVVLAFYPGDETPVCTKQMCAYSDDLGSLHGLGAVVWGISPQDLASHERFATKRSLSLPLLADTDKTAITAYGVGGRLGVKRSVFVVDGGGVLRWSHVSTVGLTYKGVDELTAVLKDLAMS